MNSLHTLTCDLLFSNENQIYSICEIISKSKSLRHFDVFEAKDMTKFNCLGG